jgi:uncharacterized membrane protein HdeD (DUF308 family)
MADQTFPRDEGRTATWGWWLLVLTGAISIVAGVIILFKPGDSLETLAVIAGIFLLVDGLLELTAALFQGTQSRGMVALLGVLTAIVGVLLIRHPIAGVAAVALLIGIWLITIGVVRFVAAFEVAEARGWNIVVGLIELIAGIAIIVDPEIGFATLALLVGIAFILNGMGLTALGWGLRELRREVAAP